MKHIFALLFCLTFLADLEAEAILRGLLTVDTEPVWLARTGGLYPLPLAGAMENAKQDAARYFSGMVYGWSFVYEAGNQARGRPEYFDITSEGGVSVEKIVFSTENTGGNSGSIFKVWADYELSQAESLRRASWRAGQLRQINSRGGAVLIAEAPGEAALKDAAKNAVRSLARGLVREKPETVYGRIALAEFPIVTLAKGEWALTAKFFAVIEDIRHFGSY